MKKTAVFGLSIVLVFLLASAGAAAYPEKNIQGLIMWGAGGGTDNFARAITPLAEQKLGQTIILRTHSFPTRPSR